MEQQSAIWKHCLQHVAQSDLGLRRANNQDSLAVAPPLVVVPTIGDPTAAARPSSLPESVFLVTGILTA